MVFDKSGCSSEPVKVMWCDVTACWMTKHWMMMVWTCMFYTVRTYCSLFDPPTHCKTVEYCFFHVQWNSVIARADGPGTFSRYSQMTNLPRETKGNNLGENANGTVRTRARRRCEEGEGGGGEGITHRTRTRLSLFFFVTSHHEMCPTGNLTTRWGWGEWRELLWPGMIESLSLLPRWLSTNSR